MFHDSPAEIVPFERFLERRRRLFRAVPPPETLGPPVSTDPGELSETGKRTAHDENHGRVVSAPGTHDTLSRASRIR